MYTCLSRNTEEKPYYHFVQKIIALNDCRALSIYVIINVHINEKSLLKYFSVNTKYQSLCVIYTDYSNIQANLEKKYKKSVCAITNQQKNLAPNTSNKNHILLFFMSTKYAVKLLKCPKDYTQ